MEVQDGSPEVTNSAPIHLDVDPEDVPKQLKVRSYPKEAFIEGNKVGDVKNSVGRNVMQLAAVEEEQPMNEVVEGKAEPPPKILLVDDTSPTYL